MGGRASTTSLTKMEKELRACKTKEAMAKKVFRAMDDDNSGTLDFYEFREQMDKNTKVTDSFWLQTFKLYDADSSGSIDEKEFVERFVKDGHDKPEDSIKFCVRVLRDAREITVIAGSKLLSNPELKASFNRTLCSEIDGVERKSNIARHGAKQMA